MGFSMLALLKLVFIVFVFFFLMAPSTSTCILLTRLTKKNSSPFLSHKYLNVDIVMINSS